jgi:uncharacterized protein YdhG (YjbR/CyaY superfamily)
MADICERTSFHASWSHRNGAKSMEKQKKMSIEDLAAMIEQNMARKEDINAVTAKVQGGRR